MGSSARTRVPRAGRASRPRAARRARPGGRPGRAGRCPPPGSAPPTPSSRDLDDGVAVVLRRRATTGVLGVGVLGDVRQRLGDDEVGGGLDRRRQALAAAWPRALPGPARALGERLQRRRPGRGRSGRPGGCRGRARAAPPARWRSSSRAPSSRRSATSGSLASLRAGQAELQRRARRAAAGRRRGGRAPGARRSARPNVDDPGARDAAAPRRGPAARPPGARSPAPARRRRPAACARARARRAAPRRGRSRRPAAPSRATSVTARGARRRRRQLDRPALAVDVALRPAQPVEQAAGSVAERVGQRVAQRSPSPLGRVEALDELADRAGADCSGVRTQADEEGVGQRERSRPATATRRASATVEPRRPGEVEPDAQRAPRSSTVPVHSTGAMLRRCGARGARALARTSDGRGRASEQRRRRAVATSTKTWATSGASMSAKALRGRVAVARPTSPPSRKDGQADDEDGEVDGDRRPALAARRLQAARREGEQHVDDQARGRAGRGRRPSV